MNIEFKLFQKLIKEYFGSCRKINKKYVEHDQLSLIAGHRGSPFKDIENTIQSYETPLTDGADF